LIWIKLQAFLDTVAGVMIVIKMLNHDTRSTAAPTNLP
jgi:hypothetical protein